MPATYLTDYAGYLTTALREYEEVVCQVTEDIGRIISTFGFIILHADFLTLTTADSPYPQASWTGVEVRRLAIDTISRAAAIRDSMQHVRQEAQGGLTKAKEVMQAVKEGGGLSHAELEHFIHRVSEVGEVLQQVSAKTDQLIPEAMDMLEVVKVLQEQVGMLTVSSGPGALHLAGRWKNNGGRSFSPAACEGRKSGRKGDVSQLLSLACPKYWEN